ncbi:tyrosine-type recombinase/integrase [Halosaccharopolyspora lacisalsi]|uniref:tyrosine-type recombinase/integrase n=1 Tax=Halosaccharopolyspora lacisalsi TaxID=1000566 RepID=UPI0015FA67A6
MRDRGEIDRLITAKTRPLQGRALFSLLYSTAARCEEVLALDIGDLDRANRRARVTRKGGRPDELMYDIRTARLLGQLLGTRTSGPVFLSDRTPRDGTVRDTDCDPETGRRRMTYRTAARHLATATGGWAPRPAALPAGPRRRRRRHRGRPAQPLRPRGLSHPPALPHAFQRRCPFPSGRPRRAAWHLDTRHERDHHPTG